MGFISKYHNKYQTGGLQHLFATLIREEVGEKVFSEYFKFTIVRNPWEKAISQYFYMQRREDLRDFIGMNADDSFITYLELIQLKSHVQWEPQYKFVCDEDENLIVDYVGRLEHMEKSANEIFEKLGLDAQINHENKTSHQHYSHYYDDHSKKLVGKMFEKDIDLFRYSFESK